MKKRRTTLFLLLFLFFAGTSFSAFDPTEPECLAPAKRGGGMYLTCELAAESLLATNLIDVAVTINTKPGGIGAVAYNHIVAIRDNDPELIVAASSGSALNLAIKKFGRYDVDDVRWLGALGTDYGVIAVRADAPWNSLDELFEALKTQQGITLGGGGSIGSQDWMKVALLLKEAGIDPKMINYVAYEGGGEALSAFAAGYIQVFPGDASELYRQFNEKQIKVLAVLSAQRLPGKFATIPTATEQGYPVEWPVWRGFYMGPGVSDEAYNWWINTFRRLVKTEEFIRQREDMGLYPFFLVGEEFTAYVRENVKQHRQTAVAIGLIDE